MRQIGRLPSAAAAHRFEAYLVSQGIAAHVEEEQGSWILWVRDEDQLSLARGSLAEFQANPEDARFQGVERLAEQRRREEAAKREEAKRQVVTMGQRWKPGTGRRRPLTLAVVVACVGIGLFTNMGQSRDSDLLRKLWFSENPAALTAGEKLAEIRQGEVWRALTPALVHYGPMHLVFNMVMFYQLATIIEHRQGTWQLAWLLLALALPSNFAQALVPIHMGGSVRFAGLSGVVFGLLGYVWMKSRFHPSVGIYIHPSSLTLPLLFLVLGFVGAFNTGNVRIANWAHGVGFAAGILIGYLPLVVKPGRAN